jgi:hypothetical protein
MALTNPIYNNLPKLANIQGFWRFEAGGNATDESDNGYTLTETSGTIDNVAGKIGNAADFEAGDTEYFTIAHASCANLRITGEITICAWVKLESSTSDIGVLGKYNYTGNLKGYAVYITSDNIVRFVLSTNGTDVIGAPSTDAIADTTWVHVGATLNQVTDKMQVYINGLANGVAVDYTSNIADMNTPFNIGVYLGSTTAYFDGLIDEVIVWNTCLTPAEIAQVASITSPGLYTSGGGAFLLNLI